MEEVDSGGRVVVIKCAAQDVVDVLARARWWTRAAYRFQTVQAPRSTGSGVSTWQL